MGVMQGRKRVKRMMAAAALALVFCLGLLGHALTDREEAEVRPLHLTLCAEGVDNALAEALSEQALKECGGWQTDGGEVRLLSFERRPSLAEGYAEGEYLRYPSVLRSDLYFSLSIPAHLREGNAYHGAVYMAVGREYTLSSPLLSLRARAVEMHFL